MKKKALLYISSYRFTKIDKYKYEFDKLESKYNLKIIIHDLSDILSKRLDSVFLGEINKKNYYKFDSISHWLKSFKYLNRKYDLTIFNNVSRYGFNSIIINFYLKQSNLPIIVSPSPQVYDPPIKQNLKSYIYKYKKIFTNPFLVYYYSKIYLVTFLNSLIIFKHLFILQSGSFSDYVVLRSKKKTIVDFHARDYSNYLNIKKNIKKKNIVTYIDTAGPYFSDDWTMIGKKLNFNLKDWYLILNNFLNFIEKKYKVKVIVVPHPKNRNQTNPYFNEKHGRFFDRSINASTKIIPISKFVLSYNAHSTAINYAIASSTPYFYTYSNEVKKDLRQYGLCLQLAKKTGCQTVNISKSNNYKKFKFNKVKVNKNIFDNYKYEYLTSDKIKGVSNYKIMASIILKKINLNKKDV